MYMFFLPTILCFTIGDHASNCRQQLLCVYTHTQKLKPNPFSQSTSLVDIPNMKNTLDYTPCADDVFD